MSNRKSLKELKENVEKEIAYVLDNIQAFEGNENPQVKEMYIQNKAKLESLKDVLDYINHGTTYQFIHK